jgi:hypothetical protein
VLEAISKILDAVSLRPSKARLDSGFGFENLSLTRGEVFLRWLLGSFEVTEETTESMLKTL